MKRTVRFCAFLALFTAFCWHEVQAHVCGDQEFWSIEGLCVPCELCPPGKEPDRKCGYGQGLGMVCKPCPADSFSASSGLELCAAHTQCEGKKRMPAIPGTPVADAFCGECLPGYYSPAGAKDPAATCLQCPPSPKDIPGCPGARKWPTRLARNAEALQRRDDRLAPNGTREGKAEESATQYAVLAIVPVFCVMGLLGILFCNLLMKKGYHCTAQKDSDEEASKADRNGGSSTGRIEDANEDTIGVLVRLITEKKENAAVLEEMLKDYHSKQLVQTSYKPVTKLHLLPQFPPICRHQHHLHTVQGLATRSGPTCTRCSQKKWPEVLRLTEAPAVAVVPGSATGKLTRPGGKAGRPGEITILSVGRFRVARIPEQKASPAEVKTISENVATEPAEAPYACLVPEQKPLVSNGVKPKWLPTADGQEEDCPFIVRLAESNLVI